MCAHELAVIDDVARRIDLARQGGALTANVLEHVRELLCVSDTYVHLCLSHNALSDEAVSVLCAILKERPLLESLELQKCDLRDKVFGLYLTPALLAHKTVRRLDLRKNSALTDASASALCTLLRECGLEQLLLQGTRLTRVGATRLVATMEQNGSLERCELPFTVGYKLIDRAARLTRRNVRYKHLLAHAAARQSLPPLTPTSHVKHAMTVAVAAAAQQQQQQSSSSSSSKATSWPTTMAPPPVTTMTNSSSNNNNNSSNSSNNSNNSHHHHRRAHVVLPSHASEADEQRRQREALTALVDGKSAQEQHALRCYRVHHGRRRAVFDSRDNDEDNENDDRDNTLDAGGSGGRVDDDDAAATTRTSRAHVTVPIARPSLQRNDNVDDTTIETTTETAQTTLPRLPPLRHLHADSRCTTARCVDNDDDEAATNAQAMTTTTTQPVTPWLDPALHTSLLHLHVMHARLRMCHAWQRTRQQKLRHARGLDKHVATTTTTSAATRLHSIASV